MHFVSWTAQFSYICLRSDSEQYRYVESKKSTVAGGDYGTYDN